MAGAAKNFCIQNRSILWQFSESFQLNSVFGCPESIADEYKARRRNVHFLIMTLILRRSRCDFTCETNKQTILSVRLSSSSKFYDWPRRVSRAQRIHSQCNTDTTDREYNSVCPLNGHDNTTKRSQQSKEEWKNEEKSCRNDAVIVVNNVSLCYFMPVTLWLRFTRSRALGCRVCTCVASPRQHRSSRKPKINRFDISKWCVDAIPLILLW